MGHVTNEMRFPFKSADHLAPLVPRCRAAILHVKVKQGVRTFRAKILTGYGRIEERTYHAPEE